MILMASYKSKRNFSKTPEPRGGKRKPGKSPIFVIQKHDAATLHYDFRLEIDGVLKSWAVPKGPSTDPRQRRLAIETEDHPLDYANFEGVIPEGEYGAGPVLVWDRGRLKNITGKDGDTQPLKMAHENGHILVRLKGKKLEGGFALHRTGKKSEGKWLLVKMDDEKADARRNPVSTQPKSVKSGKTLHQVRKSGSVTRKGR